MLICRSIEKSSLIYYNCLWTRQLTKSGSVPRRWLSSCQCQRWLQFYPPPRPSTTIRYRHGYRMVASRQRHLLLKLYCRYLYTRPCLINHIWGLKQLWLQVNGHAWFHLQRLRWPVRNGEGAKNSKWKCMSPAGFEPTPRQSTTGKLQRFRPLGHAG